MLKCEVDLCKYFDDCADNNCKIGNDLLRCILHPRDKIIKDQARRIIAQETDKFYDTIVASMAKSDSTLRIEVNRSGSYITLTGASGTYGFTVGQLTDRVEYEQAMDKFNRVRRLANG